MFVLGHLGSGTLLGRCFRGPWSILWLWAGALLPDVWDKSIFYFSSFDVGGTRSVGHTLIFWTLLTVIACLRRSRSLMALALGVFSHLLVDYVGDAIILRDPWPANLQILLWPLRGWTFPETPYLNFREQTHRLTSPYFLWTEVTGLAILIFFILRDRQKRS